MHTVARLDSSSTCSLRLMSLCIVLSTIAISVAEKEMAMFGKDSGGQKTIDSLIGMGTRIEWNLTFQGGLRIDGTVVGDVKALDGAQGMLVISEHARIEGSVRASHIVVSGAIVGPIYAMELLELQP